MWSVAVILIFFDVLKTFFPLLAFPGNFLIGRDWTHLVLPEAVYLLFLFLNYPNILCINPDILQRWCNVLICRHRWCWCWWRCRCCVGITLFFMSSHHCWWTMQSQFDSGCVDFKKMKSCVAYLWLTQSFWTNVQMACLDLKWNHVFFQQQLLKCWGIWYAYFLGVSKPRKLFAFF